MPLEMRPREAIRHRVRVSGIVQGVGFRPFVHALAARLELTGRVRNVAGGVELEIQGPAEALDAFARALRTEAPPLAAIEEIAVAPIPPEPDETNFAIETSGAAATIPTPVPPDVALCAACAAELADPADRRFRYPFINCTDCGPRFTIIEGLPYDRERTTMRTFAMCPRCREEYEDPASRRFHAEPIACPTCGPHLRFVDPAASEDETEGEAALAAAQTALDAGRIVAVHGVGGFHLACDATNEAAVARLRERKGRGGKPFAVMVPDLATARAHARIDEVEAALLESRERPIVLVESLTPDERGEGAPAPHPEGGFLGRPGERLRVLAAPLALAVAPHQTTLGLLLPYAPLHHLLLDGRVLVMTSGNRSEEPICREPEEALERLSAIADVFLLHDRPIHTVCDDSVVRVVSGQGSDRRSEREGADGVGGNRDRVLPLRRSRGYAPFPIALPRAAPPLLAVGAELKATFCLTEGRRAFLSQHIGDLANLETLRAFERAVAHLEGLFRISPVAIVADLHPGYLSTRLAERLAEERGLPLLRVQHHHAHVAALLAEHAHPGDRPVVGVSFDGTGYGTDGAIWGGEVLIADYARAERFAHLAPVPLPGGDAAVRHVNRMALAHLHAAGIPWHDDLPPVAAASATERGVLARQLASGFGTVPTTSAGRLFDAVAALAGICQRAEYEGEAAMRLEAAAVRHLDDGEPDDGEPADRFDLVERGGALLLDPTPVLRGAVADLRRTGGRDRVAGRIAARFHASVAQAIVDVAARARARTGIATAALTGGVFQNVLLLRLAVAGLERAGFTVLTHTRVPPNDGGLALGQAALAAYGGTL